MLKPTFAMSRTAHNMHVWLSYVTSRLDALKSSLDLCIVNNVCKSQHNMVMNTLWLPNAPYMYLLKRKHKASNCTRFGHLGLYCRCRLHVTVLPDSSCKRFNDSSSVIYLMTEHDTFAIDAWSCYINNCACTDKQDRSSQK